MPREFDPEQREKMDEAAAPDAELLTDLDNLRKLNRWFGSYSLVECFMRHWLQPGRALRLCDLATGFGDIPRRVIDMARQKGVDLKIDAVDANAATLTLARQASADYPEIQFIQDDVRSFDPGSTYDIVLCSLALHHFSDADAVRVLRRVRMLSHEASLVADLERSLFTKVGVHLVTTFIFREPMTVYDARLSVRRAFSFYELRNLAHEAGWEHFGHRHFFPARQAIWMHQREASAIPLTQACPEPAL